MKKKDIFDRIMDTRLMRPFQQFYYKHKEGLLYLLFGALTTLINLACFALLTSFFAMNPLIANIIAFVVGVVFAYVTNRIWVFESEATGVKSVVVEMVSFFAGRIATLLMEELLLWIGIDKLGISSMPVKVVATILVIIANYVISKWFVFKKKGMQE